MHTTIVLGGGMVGSIMAADLAADPDFDLTIADRCEHALARAAKCCGGRVRTIHADLGDADALRSLIEPFDLVLGAMPGFLGFRTLRTVLDAGKPYCDISFMPEDPRELNGLAQERGVTAIVDCGVAPGLSNMLAGYAASQLDPCDSIEIYVGGLPRERHWPFEYKAAFSPIDVIEEYTRPARLVEHGRVVVREALSEPELMDLPGVGTVEAFNTDGLRSLIDSLDVPNMKEKTLRYPGHINLMRVFRETGFFASDPITIGEHSVRPVELTAALLFPKWTYADGEIDLTVMRVIARGGLAGHPIVRSWDLLDYADPATGFSSMARTTAFPCTITARRLMSGAYPQAGVILPEEIGARDGELDHIIDSLAGRRVHVRPCSPPTA